MQVVGRLPHLAEGSLDVVDGALVDRIVWEIQLGGAQTLDEDLHQLLDLGGRQRQLGRRLTGREPAQPGQSLAPVSSATIATSLSPRPLRLMSTRSPARRPAGGAGGRAGANPPPAASTPTSSPSRSWRNAWKIPSAFDPPPTHAATAVGSRP